MAESKYAAQLRELGFKPIPEALMQFIRTVLWAGIRETLKEHRELPKEAPLDTQHSYFSKIGGSTLAKDEVGQAWLASKEIDLTALGFTDLSEKAARMSRWMVEADKDPNLN